MKRYAFVSAVVVLLGTATLPAFAGQIWTDFDGDGLPDANEFPNPPGTELTFGIWVDSQSFEWTNFIAYVEWTPDRMTFVSGECIVPVVLGCPIDDFTHPNGVGFGGSAISATSGVTHLANVTMRIDSRPCCIMPIIDIYNPYSVFSQLGNGPDYMLFTQNPGSCGGGPPPIGACCFLDGACDDRIETDCTSQGGAWLGPGTSCAAGDCSDLVAGCCLGSGSCIEVTQSECAANGGLWWPWVLCPGVFCEPFSVESQSWGRIKTLYR